MNEEILIRIEEIREEFKAAMCCVIQHAFDSLEEAISDLEEATE